MNLEDMDELFRQHPTFIPGSKWKATSRVDEEARAIAMQERAAGEVGKEKGSEMEYLEHVAS